MSSIPDVQDLRPDVPIPINRVGFKNIRIPTGRIILNGLEIILVPKFNIFIDLPRDKRGIHASRIYGVILEIVKEFSGEKVKLEEVGEEIARRLLSVHPYSSKVYIDIESPAYYKSESPVTKSVSYEHFKIHVRIIAHRELATVKYVGVEVEGLTACPCAREVVKSSFHGIDTTHMQRSRARVFLQVPRDFEVDLIQLLEIVKSSFSSPLHSYLKRIDEARIVVDALKNSKFVEDTLREIVKKIVDKWSDLPDESKILACVQSKESLHSQDIAAKINVRIGDLKKLLDM
ncbi:MAG: GTP cyclohydrolase MptA [Aigarchaeota archaeon]|nr:GTP cyclohydrolase MptA [Aigarchaeota archaeon]MCX8192818.1 GTP cyclohydrolase MptA [Nitrososphaeria archaeon]MDW7986062.1 GTP cyclohydrolase MptA [Nitrososphaerota archaeon]